MKYVNSKYYQNLRKIDHFKSHPQMRTFVGDSWGKTKKLLVIGEIK